MSQNGLSQNGLPSDSFPLFARALLSAVLWVLGGAGRPRPDVPAIGPTAVRKTPQALYGPRVPKFASICTVTQVLDVLRGAGRGLGWAGVGLVGVKWEGPGAAPAVVRGNFTWTRELRLRTRPPKGP